MFLKVLALFLCIAYAAAVNDFVNSTDCQNMTIHSKNVRMQVTGCHAGMERCPLYRGTNHSVVFFFETTSPFMNKTDFRVYGVFEKFSVPYRGKADACEPAITTEDGAACKILGGFVGGKEFKHISTFSVAATYPKINLKVRFSMSDRRSKAMLMCTEIPVEIMDVPTEANEAKK